MEVFNYLFIYFIIYSIVGWITEVFFCFVHDKYFTNRGFLHGPYCPIYGCGAMIIIYLLLPLKFNPVLVFVASMVATTILEYFTSYIMEKMFKTRWWDYSKNKFNINGRICLFNSVCFGIMGIAGMYFLHPLVKDIITKIPRDIVPIASTTLLVAFATDLTVTVTQMMNLKERLEKLKDMRARFEEKLEAITQLDLKPVIIEMFEKQVSDIIAEKRAFERRLLRSFPTLKSERFSEQIQELKERLKR